MEEARLRAGAGRAPSAAARRVRRRLGSAGRRPLAPRAPGISEPADGPTGRVAAACPLPRLDRGPTPWRASPRRASFDSGWGGCGRGAPAPGPQPLTWEGSGVSNPRGPGLARERGAPEPASARLCGQGRGREESFPGSLPAMTPPPPPASAAWCFLHLSFSLLPWAN